MLGSKKKATWNQGSWMLSPAINGGYNKLLEGYDGYEDLGNIGLDLYVKQRPDTYEYSWTQNFIYRLSFDYFPLQVPKALLGLKEDLYSINASFLYSFVFRSQGPNQGILPFLGVGIGWYQDRTTLNTKASGKVTGTTNHIGYTGSIGCFLPEFNLFIPMRIVPEVRYHQINVPDGQATNITYQAALVFWPFTRE